MNFKQKLTAKILIIMMLIECIVALGNMVMAVEDTTKQDDFSFKFTPEVDKTVVQEKDTVTMKLKLSDIDVGEEGINTFICKLKYDENFFEDVKISSQNSWSITYNNEKQNEDYGKIVAVILKSGVNDNQEIGTITFKIKSKLNVKSGEIKFTEVSTNNGTTIVNETDKSIRISIKETNKTNTNLGPNTSKGPLPQTSEKKASFIIIFTILIITIVSVISYKKYKNKK